MRRLRRTRELPTCVCPRSLRPAAASQPERLSWSAVRGMTVAGWTCCVLGAMVWTATLAQAGARQAPPAAPGPAAAPGPRPLRVEDIFALKELADPQLSPDGRWVAYTQKQLDAHADRERSSLWMAPYDGGAALRLTHAARSARQPRFSPDGRHLAFLASRAEGKAQVWLLDRRGGEARRLTRFKGGVSELAWSPDGTRLVLVVHDARPDDDDPDEADDEPVEADAGAGGAAAASDRARSTRATQTKIPQPIVIRRRQFKRDGEGYLGEDRDHLHVLELASGRSRQITSGPYDDHAPSFSPDGRTIAFVSNRTADPDANQNDDVFVIPAEGGTEPRALTRSPGTDRAPSFSPDGRWVTYEAGGDPRDMWYGTVNLGVVPVAGGAESVLTRALDRNVAQPRFSPDGRWIWFLLEDGGNRHLARVPAGGGSPERVLAGERDVSDYDLAHAAVVVLESRPQYPPEVSALAEGQAGAGELRRVTHANDEFLAGVRLAPLERFQAQSADGTAVDVFLTLPPGEPRSRRPAVLRIHGGPVAQFSTEFQLEWQMLAAHGYTVVAANPRGSSGYGQAFARAIWADWGGKDLEDVLAAVDAAVARGVADPERLGVGGWSYGGILTNYVITRSTRFKAAISGASEANYFADYGTDHYQYEWETELGLPWRNVELWRRLSPWFDIERVTTPTLILCGQDDWNVPLLNSEQLYQALRRLGKVDTELVIYPGEDHSIDRPSFVKDRLERYLAWYDKYLKRP